MIPKPFLKWAGGKTQLLYELENRLPLSVQESGIIKSYVEPFAGGGAMFFYLKAKYNVHRSCLIDTNPELIMAYKVIKKDHSALIKFLREIQSTHLSMDENSRKDNYYSIRNDYNGQMNGFDYKNRNDDWVMRTGYLIFLNKTCYNGLFRLNNKGEFNVPFGKYKNPKIFDEANLIAVHKALKNTELFSDDFTGAEKFIEKETLVYMDPPYRPLNSTSHFTDYSKDGFDDQDQKRLAQFFKDMDQRGAFLLLSNSDPQNINPDDNFFDSLYHQYKVNRVLAKRNINSKSSGRGLIKELIIRNY
jgi:DNA adenine methylase